VKVFLRLTGNLPPNWIEPCDGVTEGARTRRAQGNAPTQTVAQETPNARVTIRDAARDLRLILRQWGIAYQKECFYYGLRVLLELERAGPTRL
jgi:hypothetical protein